MAGRRRRVSSQTINLRTSAEQKGLIDRAAAALGKTRTEFMLESAQRAAEQALLDQRLFPLDDDRFAAFAERIDAPARPSAELRRLLAARPPWRE